MNTGESSYHISSKLVLMGEAPDRVDSQATALCQSPSMSLRFCTAAPDAPLPRLSSRAISTA
jgi:hypothetical protein